MENQGFEVNQEGQAVSRGSIAKTTYKEQRVYRVNSFDKWGGPIHESELFADSKKGAIQSHNDNLVEEGVEFDPSQTTAVLLKD